MNDLISRQAAIDALDVLCQEHRYKIPGKVETYSQYNEAWQDALDRAEGAIGNLPSTQPELSNVAVNAMAVEEMLKDLLPERGMWEIEGDEAKTAICEVIRDALEGLWKLPFVKPNPKESSLTQKALDTISRQPEWNNHTVACLLAELFDDPCACNYNGIDEWLPEKCEVIDSCPHPVGVACWEQYLKHRAERRIDG